MRSSPLIQLALVILGFMALAFPLLRLTQQRGVAPASQAAATVQTGLTRSIITVRYAHVPTKLKLKLGGELLLEQAGGGGAEGVMEVEKELPLSKDGLELQLLAEWPEATPSTAVTVELVPDGKDPMSQTRWSNAAGMDEILVYLWN